MKCPKCGTYNGKTNKFCRECGLHLAWVLEEENTRRDSPDAVSEDVVLGEALADVYDYYESGDLNAALAGAEKIAKGNPDSTSAHGILALVYERKGETELEAGNTSTARDFLQLALAQYEKIIDLNPGSAADREKLSTVRAKINGAPVPVVNRGVAGFKSVISSVPPQLLAGGVAFVVVAVLAIVLIPGGGKKPSRERSKVRSPRVERAATSSASQTLSGSATAKSPSGLKVYTFPAPKPVSVPNPPVPKAASTPAPKRTERQAEVKPAKLPTFGELTIVPEAKKSTEDSAKVEVEEKKAVSEASKEEVAPKVDGTNLLAEAIRLRNQGQTQAAIDSAQRAITYFRAEIDAGKNVTSAKRGIDNATKLISLWQQSVAIR